MEAHVTGGCEGGIERVNDGYTKSSAPVLGKSAELTEATATTYIPRRSAIGDTEKKDEDGMADDMILALVQAQTPEQSARDAIAQQIREQVQAARQEAQAARRTQIVIPRARAAPGTPGTVQIPFDPNQGIPPRVAGVSIAFLITVAIIILGFPIMRAIGRRVDRMGSAPRISPDVAAQLNQLSQAVDAIALEVERISEGQRFTTRLLAEQRGESSKTILAPMAGERPPGS